MKHLSDLFSCCSNFTTIFLNKNIMVGQRNYPLLKNLQNPAKQLKILHLESCGLNEHNIKNLSELFGYCSNLKIISLNNNTFLGQTKQKEFR